MKLRPISDRVVVRRDEADEATPGGIVLPDVSKERPRRGTVLAVGPGRMRMSDGGRSEMQVKVDDSVIFATYAGNEANDPDDPTRQLFVMREEEILAVVEGRGKIGSR